MANDPRPSGRVHYVLTVGVGDGTDTGREPDEIGVNGTVTFSANVERVIVGSGATRHMILPQNISATLTNGVLQWGSPLVDDVPLTANLDSAGNRLGWQWTAQFVNLTYPDPANANTPKRVNTTAYSFDVRPYDANATSDPVTGLNPTVTDLTEMAPVITGSAVQLAKGDPGDVTDLQIGTVTTGTPAATITGAAPTKFLNLVLPNAGAGGTVKSVAGQTPNGAGAVALTAANVGAVPTADKGAANGVATLDSSGLIPAAQLPAIAISDFLGTSANQAAMLAKTGQKGDWTTRTDTNTTWLITGTDPTQLSGWTQIVTPTGAVSSVAGRTGAVTIGAADIADATTVGKSLLLAADAAALRGITGSGTYSKPVGGIAPVDLAATVVASLGKADGAVQQTEHMVYIRRWTGTAWEIRGPIPDGSEGEWHSPVSVGPPPVDGTYALGGVDSYVGE